ncbi:forkhead box protein N4 [Caerostris extrusa]|uniref:Forkhead box protein N4 n=1 Tax=Caerostris extrusa TaxID=172846 RepID=A0AAV4M8J9_CAEEX|nr:forkhead box protein N4 [Caerostris extrusa]
MDICGDKLIDMINSDYRSKEFAEYNDNTFLSNGSQDFFHLDSFDDTANDGKIGWLNSSQLLNVSSDFDTDTAIYVNPGTVLPIPEPVNSPLLPEFPFTESFAIVSSESQESSVSASTNIPVISSDKVLDSSSSDETVAAPSPSPNTHNIHTFSSQESDATQDSDEGSKVKSKSKNAKSNHRVQEIIYPKPVYSYSCLIAMALKNSKTGSLPVNEIYDFMTENFPYFKTAPNGWKNSVRHNLSLNKCFKKN